MSAIVDAFLHELTDSDLQALADRLRPLLTATPTDRNDRWLRGADQIAEYIGAPRSRVYALTSARRIPIERDGSALIARTADLDEWIRAGGATRP